MKYYSEKLDKFFDDPFDLERAEEQKELKEKAANEEVEAKKAHLANRKKELANAIEDCDVELDRAYQKYEEAKKICQKILEESNTQMTDILDKAKKEISDAQEKKAKYLAAFNNEFGTFKVSYTGDKALKEFEKMMNLFDFKNSFFKF
jgi:exonuclease VII small subunit